MEYKVPADYPELTYQTEMIIRNPDNFEEVDVYFQYWSRPKKPVRALDQLIERFQQTKEMWLKAVGPDKP